MFDLVIQGGTVVSADDTRQVSVAIHKGLIAGLFAPNVELRARETINASGLIVIPGGIDPHVHLHNRLEDFYTCDDFDNGTVAAAFGGTTCFIDFPVQQTGEKPIEAVRRMQAHAESRTCLDYGLHCILTDAGPDTLRGLVDLVAAGVSSFKLFMVYRRQGLWTDDGSMLDVMAEAARLGAIVLIHAENADIVDRRVSQFIVAGDLGPSAHARSRPAIVEAEAIRRATFLASTVGAATYIVHVSSALGQAAVAEARSRGWPVYGETCTHYLCLTDEVYERDDGLDFIVSPPIRGQVDQDALWQAVRDHTLSAVGSDECAINREQRRRFGEGFDRAPNGAAGIEARIPILFGLGVATGRITLQQMVAISSTNPAKLFGLYPRKGSVMPGADADLVLLDPAQEGVLGVSTLHMGVDHSMYEGIRLQGMPVKTLVRGQVVVRDGKFVGTLGSGRFLPRAMDPSVLSGTDLSKPWEVSRAAPPAGFLPETSHAGA